MQQAKISFEESQMNFINNYSSLGFKDKSSLVRTALEVYIKELEKQKLKNSAFLYAELYKEDEELKELTNNGLEDWPL